MNYDTNSVSVNDGVMIISSLKINRPKIYTGCVPNLYEKKYILSKLVKRN